MSEKKFYGWKLVAALFFLYLIGTIVLFGGNIANTVMAEQENMSRSFFGAGFGVAYFMVGVGSALAAAIATKKGERFTVTLGMAAIAVGSLFMAVAGQVRFVYILAFGLIIGTGFAFATVLPSQTIITRWFIKKRALATSLVLTAGGVGGILGAPVVNKLIQVFEQKWKIAWLVLASLAGIATVVAALAVRNKPGDMGQLPDGITGGSVSLDQGNSDNINKTKKVFQTQEEWTLKEALRTAPIWLLVVAAVGQFVGFYLCIGHSVVHLKDIGVSADNAALSLGILAFASIGGRLLSGVLGDHIEPRFIIIVGLCFTVGGLLTIMHAVSPLTVYVYAMLVGLGFGLVYVCLFAMLGNYYGAQNIQKFLGFLIPIITLFGASSPIIGGIIKDKTGSYAIAFTGAVIIAVIGAASLFFARPPHKTSK